MRRAGARLLFVSMLLTAVGIGRAFAAEPFVIYGAVMSRGGPAKNLPPEEIPRPDPARVVDGRYGDKDTHDPVVVLSHNKGRVLAQFRDLPATVVAFDRRPPPRAALVLVFTPDAFGRLVLAGFVSGDVGGELAVIP